MLRGLHVDVGHDLVLAEERDVQEDLEGLGELQVCNFEFPKEMIEDSNFYPCKQGTSTAIILL